jgi:hypothetical protein
MFRHISMPSSGASDSKDLRHTENIWPDILTNVSFLYIYILHIILILTKIGPVQLLNFILYTSSVQC